MHEIGELGGLGNVDLIQHHDARTFHKRYTTGPSRGILRLIKAGRVCGELGLNSIQVGQRVTTGLERRAVQDVDDHRTAFDMAQELQAEALAPARSRNKPGDVGDCVPHLPGLDDPQVRHQSGEGVVGDLGAGRAQRGDE